MYLHFIFYIKTISPGSMAFPVKWFGSFFRNASWASVGATAAQSQRRKGGVARQMLSCLMVDFPDLPTSIQR
jgi:hypothetical protein